MFNTNYSINSLTVGAILGLIEAGTIAIPEIQRPFVWKKLVLPEMYIIYFQKNI